MKGSQMKINFINVLRIVGDYKNWVLEESKFDTFVKHKKYFIYYYQIKNQFPISIYSNSKEIYDPSFFSWVLLSILSRIIYGKNPFKLDEKKITSFPENV
jgi:hypothetical protein